LAVRHPLPATIVAVAVVALFSLIVVVVSLHLSGFVVDAPSVVLPPTISAIVVPVLPSSNTWRISTR
jgi:hypothetical protein